MKESPFDLPVELKALDQGQTLKKVPLSPQKNKEYADVEELRAIIHGLRGKKFWLDCGHRVTFGHYLGNNILIRNGKECEIVCGDCA